jgi:hypothetical protein
MGRFDALTNLEENTTPAEQPSVQPPAAISPLGDAPQPQREKQQSSNGKKPVTRHSGKSINTLQPKLDKFEKYSTYLRPGYRKILKNIANDRDCKSYEILDEALTAFFASRKQ